MSSSTLVRCNSCARGLMLDWQICSQDRQACLAPVLVFANAAFEDDKATSGMVPVSQNRTEIGGDVSYIFFAGGLCSLVGLDLCQTHSFFVNVQFSGLMLGAA